MWSMFTHPSVYRHVHWLKESPNTDTHTHHWYHTTNQRTICIITIHSVSLHMKNITIYFISFRHLSHTNYENLFGFISLSWKISFECVFVCACAATATVTVVWRQHASLTTWMWMSEWVSVETFISIYLFCFYNFTLFPFFYLSGRRF